LTHILLLFVSAITLMLNVLIFSKNRACQLHALLETYRRFVTGDVNLRVLGLATSAEFRRGYAILEERFDGTLLAREHDFRSDVFRLLSPSRPYTMFAVDDQIFRRPVDLNAACRVLEDARVLCVSLRLSPDITRCYMSDTDTTPPHFESGVGEALLYPWRDYAGDWGYPMSQDTTIFRTADLLPLLHRLSWNNPTESEGEMSRHPLPHPLMACYNEAAAMNVPANLVQQWSPGNRTCGGPPAKELNQRYLDGDVIDVEPMLKLRPNTCHVPTVYTFRRY